MLCKWRKKGQDSKTFEKREWTGLNHTFLYIKKSKQYTKHAFLVF